MIGLFIIKSIQFSNAFKRKMIELNMFLKAFLFFIISIIFAFNMRLQVTENSYSLLIQF